MMNGIRRGYERRRHTTTEMRAGGSAIAETAVAREYLREAFNG